MKVVKRTSSPKFEPLVLEITIETAIELREWSENLVMISTGTLSTSAMFDIMCSALRKELNR